MPKNSADADNEQYLPFDGVSKSEPEIEIPPESRSSAGTSSAPIGRPRSRKAERQELFLPVSGFIWLDPEEIEVVNHPAFQRLGRIYQLGQTHVLYRGATHKRLEHALGTLYAVHRMINAVQNNSDKALHRAGRSDQRRFGPGASLSEEEQRFTRLGALLHDMGHIAAGHTVEDELCLVGRHDEDPRLYSIFYNQAWCDDKKRTLAQCIDDGFSNYIPADLAGSALAHQIVWCLIRKVPDEKSPAPSNDIKKELESLQKVHKVLEKSSTIRLHVCRDMIGNTICADLLDYLHRDWYHVGKPRPFDERILQYMEVRTPQETKSPGLSPQPTPNDRFVISLGSRPKIRTDAISGILELLEWRYQLSESVLFHRTKLAAAAMLDRALYALWGEDPAGIESFLLPLSDEQMLANCLKHAQELVEQRQKAGKDATRAKVAVKLLLALERRALFTNLSTWFYDDLPADVRATVHTMYGESSGHLGLPPLNRWRVLEVLENDFNLPLGSLAMYCPRFGMNAKIAEVQIAVGGDTARFCDYESDHANQLSGGHLSAQLHRFQRLWRVHFFIDRQVKEMIGANGIFPVIQQAIQKLALDYRVEGEEPLQIVKSLAVNLTELSGAPWKGSKVRKEAEVAAFRDSSIATGTYPFGAPSIRSYIDESEKEGR